MKILSLEISNILSVESAKIEFQDTGLVLVEGWNHDAGRANGAGKTALFNALSFGLYDRVPRKITASEILRSGTKSGSVVVILQTGSDVIKVTRTRPKGAYFEKNGVVQSWTQQEFEANIKMTYEQFMLTMYCSQGTTERFLNVNDANKKNFLLQLLNLDEFSACKKIADEYVKQFALQQSHAAKQLASIDSMIRAYSESVIDSDTTYLEIEELSKDIEILNKELISKQSVPKPDLSKYLKLETDLSLKVKNFIIIKTKRSGLADQYRKLYSRIVPFNPGAACDECGSPADEVKHNAAMKVLSDELATIKSNIDSYDAELAKENSVKDLVKKLNDKKNKESFDYQSAYESLINLRGLITTKQTMLQNLNLKLSKNNEIQSKINKLELQREKETKLSLQAAQEIELYKTISSLYSATGAQAYILDFTVESFNEIIDTYIDLVWPNVSYRLNSYKESGKGEMTAKFSETLTMDGIERSIGSLSGGEQRALSLCVDFAILDVLERHFALSLNPIILDEPFNDLDDVGREIVVDTLEKLSKQRQILVIEHSSEAKTKFTKSILVEKTKGVSTVKVDM